jgi:hypothetical protein
VTAPGSLTPVGDYVVEIAAGKPVPEAADEFPEALSLGPIPGACEQTRVGYAPAVHLPATRHALPDLDTCGHDEVLDLAANALHRDDDLWALSGSQLHIRAICQQVERLDLDLMAAQDVVASQGRVIVHQQVEMATLRQQVKDLELMVRTERDRLEGEAVMHNETMSRLFAQTAESLCLTRERDLLTTEANTLRAALDTMTTGRRRAPTARVIDVSDSSPDTDVVDMDGHDEPAVCRTITPRVHVPQMRQLVGGER